MNPKKLFVVILIFVFLSGCSTPEESSEFETVYIRDNGTTGQAPFYIALEEGYFEEFGVEVVLVQLNRSSEGIAALIAGDLDVTSGGNGEAIINTINNEEGIIVTADRGHISKGQCTYYGILINKELYESGEVTGPEDFGDLEVSGSLTGLGGFFMDLFVGPAGIKLSDLNLYSIPQSAIEDALANQTVKVAGLVEPRLSAAIASGAGVLAIGFEEVVDDFQISILTYGKRLTIDNRQLGVNFMAGYLKGVKQFNEGKTDRNLEIVSKYTEIPISELESTCWPDIFEDGHISYDSFIDYQNWAVESGSLDKTISEEDFWDSYFTEEAYKLINK